MTLVCYHTDDSSIMGVGSSLSTEASDIVLRESNGHNSESRNNNKTTTGSISLRSYSKLSQISDTLLETHRYTKRLTVLCPGCEPDWLSPEVHGLFMRLGDLPHLEEVVLNCVGLLEVAFPISLLKVLLEACPNLQSLELDDVALGCGSHANNDVVDLAILIQRLATRTRTGGHFREFRIFGCLSDDALTTGGPSSHSLLDPLWASMAYLERVEIDAVDDGLLGTVSSTTMQKIAQSSTLKHFHLHGFLLDDPCLTQFASAMQDNMVLQDLSLDLLAKSIGPGALALSHSLRINQHLQKLHISLAHPTWNDDVFFRALAIDLTTDCTLQSLIIGTCAIVSDETAHYFVEMMQYNHTLQVLQLSRYKGLWKSHLHYYLKLNSQRRGYFHSNFCSLLKDEWVEDGLIPIRDDIHGIFYFLLMNPVLLSSAVAC
jgi:hypothetical protein